MIGLIKIIYDVIVGLQYGDEGKGKVAQEKALSGIYHIVARFGGGPNAGHTMYHKGEKIVTQHVPAGILADMVKINLIGPGCVIDPSILKQECLMLQAVGCDIGTIYISELAHLITPYEKSIDGGMNGHIGTTGRGIGPTYAHKSHRIGLRVGDTLAKETNVDLSYSIRKKLKAFSKDLFFYRKEWLSVCETDVEKWCQAVEWIQSNIKIASSTFLHSGGEAEKILGRKEIRVLAEGAQAVMLDPTYGSYPYVTSSHCIASYAQTGIGLSGYAQKGKVIGVFKAYSTRVGNGPFPTEIIDGAFDNSGPRIKKAGQEFGSTTGRDRRIGWLDLPQLRYACEVNGVDELIMTKVDILSPEVIDDVYLCTEHTHDGRIHRRFQSWSCKSLSRDIDINGSLGNFIGCINQHLGKHVDCISFGPGADELVSIIPFFQGAINL